MAQCIYLKKSETFHSVVIYEKDSQDFNYFWTIQDDFFIPSFFF